MRGQKKTIRSLKLTGKVCLQYVDDGVIAGAIKGDVLLYLNAEALSSFDSSDYYKKNLGGYFKADIFDGKTWCPLNVAEFCEQKEYYISKSELAIDRYHLCREIFESKIDTEVYRTYRLHYSTYLHVENPYKGKKSAIKKKK